MSCQGDARMMHGGSKARVYRLVRTDRHPRYGDMRETIGRFARKAEAVQAARAFIRRWRTEERGTAWKEARDGSVWELRKRHQTVGRINVETEGAE